MYMTLMGETITVDVTELMMHQGIRVKDLPSGKWTPVSDAETMIVHVVAVKAVEEPAPAAAEAATAAPAEPEVIKKGKTDEDKK